MPRLHPRPTVSLSARVVAQPPPRCALIPGAAANSPSHPMTSPWYSVNLHTPFPTSGSPHTTLTPAASVQAEPWHSSAARSMPTPSALSAAGNRTQCSGTYTPRPSHSSETWPRPCSHMATSHYCLGPTCLPTSPPRWPTPNAPMFPIATRGWPTSSLPPTRVGGPPMALWRMGRWAQP